MWRASVQSLGIIALFDLAYLKNIFGFNPIRLYISKVASNNNNSNNKHVLCGA